MNTRYSQYIPRSTLRYVLVIMSFCYLPHIATSPWWLSLLALLTLLYQYIVNHRHLTIPPWWIRLGLILILLGLLKWNYGSFFSAGFFIGALLAFFWLKVIELAKLRDVRVIVLCSFYIIFTALLQHQSLWVLIYMVVATLANILLLIKLDVPTMPLKQLSTYSLSLLLIAIPIAFIMFFIFPRFNDPLWQVNLPSQGKIGFNETMSPGSLTSLFPDETTVMRITFIRSKPEPGIYWQGLILNHYDGITWRSELQFGSPFKPLKVLQSRDTVDYEVLLEPHNKTWLFYIADPIAGMPKLQFTASSGLMRLDGQSIHQRFAYGLVTEPAIYHPLTLVAIRQNVQLPKQSNTRLKNWAINEKNKAGNDIKQFVNQIKYYIRHEPFWYSLTPLPIGQDNQQLDRFWFETRQGYCEHYASAVTFILRSAGIPARVVIGYYGGEFNPQAQYLNVRQKDAHAWIEYWQDNVGWTLFDPSKSIAPERIDDTIQLQAEQRERTFFASWDTYRLNLTWLSTLQLSLESAKYFWERWLIFYNHERQLAILQSLGLGTWTWMQLMQAWIATLILFMIIGFLWYQFRFRRARDPLIKEYHRLQRELKKLNILISPYTTLTHQWLELANRFPTHRDLIIDYLTQYELLRLRKPSNDTVLNKKATKLLFKSFRKKIHALRLNAQ